MNKTVEPKRTTRPPQISGVSAKATKSSKLQAASRTSKTTAARSTSAIAKYQTTRSPRKVGTTFLIAFGVLVVIVASYAVYISTATRQPWFPAAAGETSSESIAGGAMQKPRGGSTLAPPAKPARVGTTVAPKQSVPVIHPNAVVDVPRVSLRRTPSIKAKSASGYLKRGELVEIVGRHSAGPAGWVKIKTKTGKVGWAFASVVREHTRG